MPTYHDHYPVDSQAIPGPDDPAIKRLQAEKLAAAVKPVRDALLRSKPPAEDDEADRL